MKIINKSYNIKGDINTNIVLISDIHYYNKKDLIHLNKVLDNIKKIKPNFICIPGDLLDESNIKDEEYLIKWLEDLSSICKVILSLGNHELYINKSKKIFGFNNKLLRQIKRVKNLYLLDNENTIIDNINFMGLTLDIEDYYNENNSTINFNNIKTNKNYYNILLCHSPINISNEKVLKNKNIDLILCGHMHGGLMPRFLRKIFKNSGIISPNKRLFPKNAYGNLRIENTNIIITSGITVISHLNNFRILKKLFSSEIVSINIDNN